jgi:hypothetical protein
MTKPCWQINAIGNSLNGWRFKMKSAKVFINKDDAEAYIPKFRDLCTSKDYVECAVDDESLKLDLLQLELVE